MANPIKLGVVGLGRAGWGMHFDELAGKEDKFQIVAACDLIEERNALAKERVGCRTYATIDDLLQDKEVEMVDIATRSCDHYEHACKALAAGKDVILEKPACTDYAQFEDLLTRANKPGLPKLFFRQNRRFEAGFNELKRVVESGVLGHVFELRLSNQGYQRRDDWQTVSKYGGGQVYNWGPHLLDHAVQLLNSPIVRTNTNRILGAAAGDCEDHFSVTMTAESGRFATVSISGSVALGVGRIYTAYGSKGTAIMTNNSMQLRYIDPEQVLPPVIADEGTPGNSFGKTGTFAAAVEPKWIEKTYTVGGEDLTEFWIHVYETYRNNKPFPIKDEEVKAYMQVVAEINKVALVKADDI